MNLLKDGYGLGALLHSSLAKQAKALYAVILSKSISVTPLRQSGFIVPKFCLASQAVQKTGASVTATQTRLQSLYEGMTPQNKLAMANMWGGTYGPRVNPLTNIFIGESQNLKTIGGIYHA